MVCVVGNVIRLFIRNCYVVIECRFFWDQFLYVFFEVCYEFFFWLNNIDFINGKVMLFKLSVVGVVYFDVSDFGFGGYYVQCGLDLVLGVWFYEEMQISFIFREILVVKFVLFFLVNELLGLVYG